MCSLICSVNCDIINLAYVPLIIGYVFTLWIHVLTMYLCFLQANTFQVVVATDGIVSYVCFVYGAIEWGPFSNIGFNGAVPGRSFMLPQALSFDTIDIEFTSNVGEQGLYIYRVDLPLIIELDGMYDYS